MGAKNIEKGKRQIETKEGQEGVNSEGGGRTKLVSSGMKGSVVKG